MSENAIAIEKIANGELKENCYVVSNSDMDCIIIDPGDEADRIIGVIEDKKLNVLAILNTHGHYDHIGAVAGLKNHFKVPFYIHSADRKLVKSANLYIKLFNGKNAIVIPEMDDFFDNKESTMYFGRIQIHIVETPGHTNGSICLLINNHLFTGDTLFKGSVGRVDFPGGSAKKLRNSLNILSKLPGTTTIHPGHGGDSSIEQEVCNNKVFIEASHEHHN